MKTEDIEQIWNAFAPWSCFPEWKKLDSTQRSMAKNFARAYERHGMRRAVEIAEGLGFGAYGNRSLAYVDELKKAVEEELRKDGSSG